MIKILVIGVFMSCLFFSPEPALGQYGFTLSSTQASPAASAVVELSFHSPEDPQDPDPFATVKYEGAGVFQSGLALNFDWERNEVLRIGPDGYEDPGDGFWEPNDIRVCTDYNEGSETCTNGWQDNTHQLTVPSITGDDTVEKTLAFEVQGGGEALDYRYDLYPISGTAVTTMPYTLSTSPDLYYRDGNDTIGIWTQRSASVPQGALNKPLLIVEGIDLSNDTHPYSNYGRLNEFALQARNEGYDITIISFQSPLSSITQHEEVLRRAIQLIHDLKADKSEPTAIAGLSRGGLVARYALAKMEGIGTPHHTSLLLSYDAPQRGANLNTDLQQALFGDGFVADNAPQDVKSRLGSEAVKELLIDHVEHSQPTTEQEALFNEISGLNGGGGYPTQPRIVAWSNGTWIQPSFDTNLAFEVVTDGNVINDKKYELTNLDKQAGSYLPSSLDINESGFILRSRARLINSLTFGLAGKVFVGGDDLPTFFYFTRRSDPTFIPTSSATDKDSWTHSSAFDCVTGADARSSHAAFSDEAETFVLDELRYAFGDASQPGNCEPLIAPLSVTISGPSQQAAGEQGTWTANASGGDRSFTYQWYRKYDADNSFYPINGGTSSTYSSSFQGNVVLKVVTTSNGATDSDTHAVTVDCNPCVQSPIGKSKVDSTSAIGAAEKVASEHVLPDQFALEASYPNPVRTQATISYALPEAAEVTLTVYDVLGRKVKRLVQSAHAAGFHRAQFDASGLPSGTYLYRLRAGTFTKTKRMVVVR